MNTSEYNHEYYLKEKERLREQRRLYYQTHKEQCFARYKKWRDKNKEKIN